MSLPNHQKYHFRVIKRTGCRNLSAFPDRLFVDISQVVSSQRSPQWSAFRPWWSHLAWLKWDLHGKLTPDFWCLHWYCTNIRSWVVGAIPSCCRKLAHCRTLPCGTTELIYAEHTGGGTEVRGTRQLRPYPEEVRGDQSVRLQVPDVCLLPARFSTELREAGFVWMQKKKSQGMP